MIAAQDARIDLLIELFDGLFRERYNTILVLGQSEPVYLPADDQSPHHRVIFAHGYFASALHEIAHWCIAGAKRRRQEDYGYWYRPDGRTQQEQVAFEQVEIKPQALEWIFSVAAGHPFVFSADNLTGNSSASHSFKRAVWEQVQTFLREGLPKRASLFAHALRRHFGTPSPLMPHQFPQP